ncbi:MAG: TlpA family protein disulfide reductase [Streptosporangiaceae bacterium]
MTAGILVCVVVLAAASAFGVARRRRDGKLTQPRPVRLSPDQLGQPLGGRATLLQFSSEFCAPCRATRQVLGEVARGLDGVTHVEVDAAERLDLVRLLDVRRTPTVFVLGPDGRVTRRGSGAMRKDEVLAALGAAG